MSHQIHSLGKSLASKPINEAGVQPSLSKSTLAGAEVPPILKASALRHYLGGIGNTTLWSWIKSKGFPKPIEIGSRQRLFRTDEVNAWLEQQAVKQAANATAKVPHE